MAGNENLACDDDYKRSSEDILRIYRKISAIIHSMEEVVSRCSDEERRKELLSYITELLGPLGNLGIWVRTYGSSVGEKLNRENHLILERDTYQTLVKILQWDRVDVRQLARWIREMKELTSRIGLDVPCLLHVKQIPTEVIPKDVEKYPVVVLDRQGYCLCGMDLEEIHYIDEVRELITEK